MLFPMKWGSRLAQAEEAWGHHSLLGLPLPHTYVYLEEDLHCVGIPSPPY